MSEPQARGQTADGARDVALHRALRTERTMARIRWLAVPFALVQTVTYYIPHEPWTYELSLALVALLAAGNVVITVLMRRVTTVRAARVLSVGALTFDLVVVMGLVFVYTFDPETAMFALVYLLPLEGAIRFQLRGALLTMLAATALYTLREVFGAVAYGNDFLAVSVSFRMGIGFIIAAVAGAMASSLVGEREEVERGKAALEGQAAELAAANRELRRANEVQDDFVAMTNHELRTPLTTILGYTGTLQRAWEHFDDAERLEIVRRIELQGRRLLALVEGLLTLSSGQAGALNLTFGPVRAREAIIRSIEECGLEPDAVAIDCPADATVWADAERLGQILTNYLSNASKYGAAPFAVEVQQQGSFVVFAVTDAGEGVPDDFAPLLFERFTQASRGDLRTAAGTGLGLAIVAFLAEAQGGEVWFEHNRPRGARFCLRMPTAEGVAVDGMPPADRQQQVGG